jgi:molybdenum cofactor guanylyltransferase
MSQSGITVAVLAGGGSRRFGSDKRLAAVGGTTLLGRTLALAGEVGDDVLLVVADAADGRRTMHQLGLGTDDVRLVTDTRRDHGPDRGQGVGPVAGLEAALMAARTELVLVLAGDHPRLGRGLLDLVITTAQRASDTTAVALAGPLGPEPMLAVYRRDALAHVGALIDSGTRRMVDVLAALEPLVIDAATWRDVDPEGEGLSDVDTPEDMTRLS